MVSRGLDICIVQLALSGLDNCTIDIAAGLLGLSRIWNMPGLCHLLVQTTFGWTALGPGLLIQATEWKRNGLLRWHMATHSQVLWDSPLLYRCLKLNWVRCQYGTLE